jgi:RimJ/RimL family protein N-acetyltransferase
VPEIGTERLRLRPLDVGDLDAWHRQIFSDPRVTRYLPVRKPIPREDVVERLSSQVESWQVRGFGVWAILEKASNQLIGHSGFVTPEAPDLIELIYALGRDWWGRGFATEAAAACLRHGFQVLNFAEVAALAFPENEPSIRVMGKLGFTFEDTVARFGVELVRYRVDADSFWGSSNARLGAVTGDLVVRAARPTDARAIAEVSVASRRWSYRDLLADADLAALSVEATTADFAEGLTHLSPDSAVFAAELGGRVVGYAYVLPSPDADIPAGTSELGSLYVTEDVAGTAVAPALTDAAAEHAHAAGHRLLTLWVRPENARARRFYEKYGLRPDGGERSRPHEILPIQIHEIRYRMSLGAHGPQRDE